MKLLHHLNIDQSWTLFLDRDGVINRRLPDDYVKKLEEFEFLPDVPDAIRKLSQIFGCVIVVTNQQGIGKGLMTVQDLSIIHDEMCREIESHGGRIDKIYFSPHLKSEQSNMRKPGSGMAQAAKLDFPEIDMKKSIMAGDSESDMWFAKNSGMHAVWINSEGVKDETGIALASFENLPRFVTAIQ